jgi:hypothetical protein
MDASVLTANLQAVPNAQAAAAAATVVILLVGSFLACGSCCCCRPAHVTEQMSGARLVCVWLPLRYVQAVL